jgi:hypothetical protein
MKFGLEKLQIWSLEPNATSSLEAVHVQLRKAKLWPPAAPKKNN